MTSLVGAPEDKPAKIEGGKALFRERLKPAEYAERRGAIDPALLDAATIEADKSPQWGIRIGSVAKGSPADAASLAPGWILTRCNGRELWTRGQSIDANKAKREFVAVSPDGREQTFHFGPGMLGIEMSDWCHPEVTVLRDLPQGPWMLDVLAAAQGWRLCDEEFVETAMNHAVAKGMPPNVIADFYAALIALDRGDNVQAKTLCDSVLLVVTKDGDIPRFYRSGMRALASGLNDMKLLETSSKELEGIKRMLQPGEIQNLQKMGADNLKSSLLPQALAKAGENVMSKTKVPDDDWKNMGLNNDPRDIGGSKNPSIEPGKYVAIPFVGPEPMHDLIWEIKGVYGEKPEPGAHSISFSIFDTKTRDEYAKRREMNTAKWTVAGLYSSHTSDSSERLAEYGIGLGAGLLEVKRKFPRLTDAETAQLKQDVSRQAPLTPAAPDHVFDIIFIRMGNEAEILVNGVSWEHLPLGSDVGDLGCQLYVSGGEVHIFSSTLRAIGR